MKKRKNIITVAIDSPAAAGAGTQAKLIAKHYNLLQLDTGRIYRLIGKLKLENPKKFNYSQIKKKIKKLKIKDLNNKNLLSDKVATSASIIAKDKKIRNIVHKFQQECAYSPPMKYDGSVLDGRDIITVQVKDAMFKFFITASLKVRSKRRFKEFRSLKKKITFKEVVKRMLPSGPLAKKQLTKLKIYTGENHPHTAQNPTMIELGKLNSKNLIRN